MGRAHRLEEAQVQPAADHVPGVAKSAVDALLEVMHPIVRAVGATVGPHCEVVLHDLRVPERSIVAIANGSVTGRRIGGPVIGGPMKDVALKLLDSDLNESTLSIGYTTFTRDGRELRSTSLVLRTLDGEPVIAFCINVDLSAITMAKALLEEISTGREGGREPASQAEISQIEVANVIAQMIREALDEVGKPPRFMARDERLRVVRIMHERGLFLIRGGVERAADALGISRFTLYSYLKEVRAT